MASYHTRSLSFPSNSHPVAGQLDQQLCRLRSSQAASTSSLTEKLNTLNELYKSVEEFLQLPQNQSQQQDLVEKVLDGSLSLLDICSKSRDVLALSKERIQDIQSALRRRCSGELDISIEVAEYLKTRKVSKKTIKKSLKNIIEAEQTTKGSSIESMLKDVNTITLDIFKSVLSYIGGSQKSSFSFSKLGRQTAATIISEFDVVDAALISQKKKVNVDMSQFVKLESEIQEIDEVLECLYRHLVKTRSTLLNVLSN